MSKPITIDDLKKLKTGYYLGVSSHSELAETIQNITECEYNHGGILADQNNKLRVYEADFRGNKNGAGIVITDLDGYLYSDKILLFRKPLFEFTEENILEVMLDNVGRINYSYFDLIVAFPVKYFCRKLFKKEVWIGSKENNKKSMVCSAWVAFVYNSVCPGIPFFKKFKSISPGDLAMDNKYFEDVFIIVNRQIIDINILVADTMKRIEIERERIR